MKPAILAATLLLAGCKDKYGCPGGIFPDYECQDRARYNSSVCMDSVTLVSTAAGTANGITCNNVHHRLRVEPVEKSGNQIGTLVFCECQKGEPGDRNR